MTTSTNFVLYLQYLLSVNHSLVFGLFIIQIVVCYGFDTLQIIFDLSQYILGERLPEAILFAASLALCLAAMEVCTAFAASALLQL